MRMILAQSEDGFLAKGPNDDMKWTGKDDKTIFKLLTLFGEGMLLAGRVTADLMPKLPGRPLIPLSRNNLSLQKAAVSFPSATLIGGPTVAFEALRLGLVSRFVLTTVPVKLGSGIPATELWGPLSDQFTNTYLMELGGLKVTAFCKLEEPKKAENASISASPGDLN